MKFLLTIITFIFFFINIPKIALCQKELYSNHKDSLFFSWTIDGYFRGANVHPFKIFSPFLMREKIEELDLLQLKNLGVNLVVANFPGIYQYHWPYRIDSFHLKNLDRIVQMCDKIKMPLVIALRSGPGRSLYSFFDKIREDEIFYHDSVAKSKYIEMCIKISERYKHSSSLVGINFLLEPHGDQPVFYPPIDDSLYYEFIQEIILNVRKVNSKLPIIVQLQGWGSPKKFSSLKKFSDSLIVYSFNMYFPYEFTNKINDKEYPGYYEDNGINVFVDSTYLESYLFDVINFKKIHNVPVFVNEYGGIKYKKGIEHYINDLHEIFLKYGFHFAFYVWKSDWGELDGRTFDEFNYFKNFHKHYNILSTEEPLLKEFIKVWKR